MSKTLFYASLVWGMFAFAHPNYASETGLTPMDEPPAQVTLSPGTIGNYNNFIDEDRVKFYRAHYGRSDTSAFNNTLNFNIAFEKKFTPLLDLIVPARLSMSKLTSSNVDPKDEAALTASGLSLMEIANYKKHRANVDTYKKHLMLKGKTIYNFPFTYHNFSFADGFLISPDQVLQALADLGIKSEIIKRINATKFSYFTIGHLEFPPPELDDKEQGANVIQGYINVTKDLITLQRNRLKEDGYTLVAAVPHQPYVSKDDSCDDAVALRFLGEPPSDATSDATSLLANSLESSLIRTIIYELEYNTEEMDKFLIPIQSSSPDYYFKILCEGMDKWEIKSWNCPTVTYGPVRFTRAILDNVNNPNLINITPIIKETVRTLLGRKFNILILERIKENLIKQRNPKTGFDGEGIVDDGIL